MVQAMVAGVPVGEGARLCDPHLLETPRLSAGRRESGSQRPWLGCRLQTEKRVQT